MLLKNAQSANIMIRNKKLLGAKHARQNLFRFLQILRDVRAVEGSLRNKKAAIMSNVFAAMNFVFCVPRPGIKIISASIKYLNGQDFLTSYVLC